MAGRTKWALFAAACAALTLAAFSGGPPPGRAPEPGPRPGLGRFEGPPGALLTEALPDFIEEDPSWKVPLERRVVVSFKYDTTVADANRLLRDLDARVLGGTRFGLAFTLLVPLPAGDSLRRLSTHPKVENAAHDVEMSPEGGRDGR